MQESDRKNLQKLGTEIKTLRLQRKWKLVTLSYRAGIVPSTLSRIEKGQDEPKYLTLIKLANAFDFSITEFFKNI